MQRSPTRCRRDLSAEAGDDERRQGGFLFDLVCRRARFSFADGLVIFAGPRLQRPDDRKDYGEPRIRAAGLIEGIPFMVVYTVRDDCFRIISAQKMHRKEWIKWQE